MIERQILTFNVQKYNMYDGPGIRTIVFFKGCPLRCKWCSNPESQLRRFDILFKRDNCIDCGVCVDVCPVGIHKVENGKHIVDRSIECVGCRKCESACPVNALAIVGENKTISEIVSIVEEDRPFYETSGGGATLGGGEALMQHEGALNLLTALKQEYFHTAIETCGYTKLEKLKEIAPNVDLFLFDIKQMNNEKHYELTGVRNDMILKNLQFLLENRYNVRLRLPTLKGLNDDDENILSLVKFLEPYKELKNFKGVDILPYHKMGVQKYAQLDKEYDMPNDNYSISSEDIERIENHFKANAIEVATILH